MNKIYIIVSLLIIVLAARLQVPIGKMSVEGDTLAASYMSCHQVVEYDKANGVYEKLAREDWLLTRISFLVMLCGAFVGYFIGKRWDVPDWIC